MYAKAADLDGDSDYAWDLLDATFYGFRDEAFSLDDLKGRADAFYAGQGRDPSHLGYGIRMLRSAGGPEKGDELVMPYLKPALDAMAGNEDAAVAAARSQIEIEYAILVDKDLDQALTLKRATYDEGWMDEPNQLNSFAWWCFEHSINLEEAESLARRGIELSPAGPDRASILDTAAEICNARSNCEDAVELMRQAVAEAPEKEHFKKQLERFEKIRAESVN